MNTNQNNEFKPEYWYIEGRAYDLSKFNHPGGDVALQMGKGRDATELVHSYHPFSEQRYRAILNKYLVRDSVSLTQGQDIKNKGNDFVSSPFVWSQEGSPFFNELRDRVQEKLNGAHYATPFRWLQIFLFALTTLAILPSFVSGQWWALFAFPLAYWVFGVNTFHDASHFSLSKDWRINSLFMYLSPGFSSPFTWMHQHVIGHHVYTNMQQDPDMHHGRKFWRYSPDREYRSFFQYQLYYFWLIWTQVTMFLAFVLDASFFLRGHYENIAMMPIPTSRKIIHVAGRIFTFTLFYLWPFATNFSWTQALIFSIVPNAIFSCCFAISSQLNHINEENMHGQVFPDWYQHQVETSHTFEPKSLFWFTLTGGLNLQIEHHLFPGINAWLLRDIQPIVQALCEKHGVHYNLSSTIGEAVGKHFSHLKEMSKNPIKQE